MSSWLDRNAREWLAGEPEAGPPERRGAAVAAYAGALGAASVLSACRQTLRERGSTESIEASCRELLSLVEKLETQVDRTGSAGPSPRHGVEVFLDTFDACASVLDVAEREVRSVRSEDVCELWTGAELAAASMEALAISVRVGLPQIMDESYARPTKGRLVRSLHEARRVRERILQAVEGRLVL